MKELYYVNGIGKGYTWKELLQWCYDSINNGNNYSWWNNFRNFNEFFPSFKNNPNDGIYTKGYFKSVVDYVESIEIVGPLRKYDGRYRNITHRKNIWIPPKFTPKKYQVTDSYGRIIPSGYIRDCYLKFKPNISVKSCLQHYYRRFGDFVFRKGPVQGIHKYKNGCWPKINHSNHGKFGNECRSTLCFKTELKDYDFKIKYNNGRANLVKYYYTDWDYPYAGRNEKRSWKRNKKHKKQWMRGLRNKSS